MAQRLRELVAPIKAPKPHSYGGSQSFITAVPDDVMCSSDLRGYQAITWCTYTHMHTTQTHTRSKKTHEQLGMRDYGDRLLCKANFVKLSVYGPPEGSLKGKAPETPPALCHCLSQSCYWPWSSLTSLQLKWCVQLMKGEENDASLRQGL